MTTPLLFLSAPLSIGGVSLNPFDWSTSTYLIAIAVVLAVHQLVPRDERWFLRLGREMLLIAPAVFLYFAVRGMVDAHEREAEAIRNAEYLINFQKTLGIFHELTLQGWVVGSDALVTLMNWIYIWGHWPVVVGTLVWLIIWRPDTVQVYRNAFLLSGILAMFVFALYPMAPPRLMPDFAFVDTVTQQSQSYRVLQPPALTNPFAAMPSLHLGWNLLMGIAIIRESRLRAARAFGYVMPVAMFLAIVLTGNHYFLDGVAGGLLVIGSLWAVMTLPKRWQTTGDAMKPQPARLPASRRMPASVALSWVGSDRHDVPEEADTRPDKPAAEYRTVARRAYRSPDRRSKELVQTGHPVASGTPLSRDQQSDG